MRGADAQDTELLARDIEQQAPLQLQQAQNVQAWRWMARRISQLSMSMACRFWTLCAPTVGACGALKPVASVALPSLWPSTLLRPNGSLNHRTSVRTDLSWQPRKNGALQTENPAAGHSKPLARIRSLVVVQLPAAKVPGEPISRRFVTAGCDCTEP